MTYLLVKYTKLMVIVERRLVVSTKMFVTMCRRFEYCSFDNGFSTNQNCPLVAHVTLSENKLSGK